jgi:hypothetical protein
MSSSSSSSSTCSVSKKSAVHPEFRNS